MSIEAEAKPDPEHVCVSCGGSCPRFECDTLLSWFNEPHMPHPATQPKEPEQESVAFNVTIEGEAARLLAAMLEPALDGDDPTAIRLMVGNGHSGYGIYVADDEYPEEGADLLVNTTPPQRKPLPKGEWPKHPSKYVGDAYVGYSTSDLDNYAMQVLSAHGIEVQP